MSHIFSRGAFSSNGFTRNQNARQIEKHVDAHIFDFEEGNEADFYLDNGNYEPLNYDEINELNFWGIYHTKSGSFNENFFQPADR